MLYPKEDKENKVLMYACRNCDYKQVHRLIREKGKNWVFQGGKDPEKYTKTPKMAIETLKRPQ